MDQEGKREDCGKCKKRDVDRLQERNRKGKRGTNFAPEQAMKAPSRNRCIAVVCS
jgi:hypothetical protein